MHDQVTCPHCGKSFKSITSTHKARCPGWPKAPPPPPCLCGHTAKSLTTMKRHRKKCEIWKNRDKEAVKKARTKETNIQRWGGDPANHPDIIARRKATNLERYGSENVMHNPEIAQRALERGGGPPPPMRGQDNPFAKPEVQAKIRETLLERYGEDNPQKVPEIREKTRQTNKSRYGYREPLASPERRKQIRETCEEKYGGPAPSCDPEVVEKARQTNLERHGYEWTNQIPEVRQAQLDTMHENYGSHFFASDEGKEAVRLGMIENHGVHAPTLCPTIRQKQIDNFRANHPGIDWPGLLPNKEGMNGFESAVLEVCPPSVEFTGDKTFWRHLPEWRDGAHKNPDFIVKPFRASGSKVIECNGDYWHSLNFNGRTKEEYESDLIAAYAAVGIQCLVIWESDWKVDPEAVRKRIESFVVVPAKEEPEEETILDLFG